MQSSSNQSSPETSGSKAKLLIVGVNPTSEQLVASLMVHRNLAISLYDPNILSCEDLSEGETHSGVGEVTRAQHAASRYNDDG